MQKMIVTTQLHDVESEILGKKIPVSAILPPAFNIDGPALPLLIYIDGGVGDRLSLVERASFYSQLFAKTLLPPMVVVSFSTIPGQQDPEHWQQWVANELPCWARDTYGVNIDPAHTLLIGMSAGGDATLKIGLKNPERFCAIAALEPAIMPTLVWPEQNKRSSWWMPIQTIKLFWGSTAKFMANNPANIVRDNAQAIRESGLEIYLEVGDQDCLKVHDGTEFLHRMMWENDITHEYHLVRWADHGGQSIEPRLSEALGFLAAALSGNRIEATDLPLTEEEKLYVECIVAPPSFDELTTEDILRANFVRVMNRSGINTDRNPSVLAAIYTTGQRFVDDPTKNRAYGVLPGTK